MKVIDTQLISHFFSLSIVYYLKLETFILAYIILSRSITWLGRLSSHLSDQNNNSRFSSLLLRALRCVGNCLIQS